MDNGQNDILSKLLSDPKNLALIASVAKNYMNTNNNQISNTENIAEPEEERKEVATEISNANPEISDLPQRNLPHFSERENLLLSLKPYLKAERQPKVDSLIKALNIAKIISSYSKNVDQQ